MPLRAHSDVSLCTLTAALRARQSLATRRMPVLRRLLLIVGVSSLAAWMAIGSYMRATNSWGAFALAPFLLPLFMVAAAVAGLGAVVCLWSWRQHRVDLPMSLIALVHGAIFYYASTHK